MKKTTCQILSKHLPARLEQHESIKLASALGLTTMVSWCWYLTARRYLRKCQIEGCVLATFLLVCNLVSQRAEAEQEPLIVQCRSPTILLSQQVQMLS